mgnify:CR=1 FL=1
MKKEELKKEFLKYVHKGDSTVSPYDLVDCCMVLAQQYTNIETAALRKEVEELRAENEMLKNYCNDLPRDKKIKVK